MSARIPTRRLGQSVLAAYRPRSIFWITSSRPFTSSNSRLAKQDYPKKTNDIDPNDPLANPLLHKFLTEQETRGPTERPSIEPGDLSSNSIFQPQYEDPEWRENMTPTEKLAYDKIREERDARIEAQREHDLHALALDPAPAARRKLERKLLIRNAMRHGRISKAVKLKRTERESTYKSPFFPTSVKKLTKLMHLIQGKTVEEALVQLRLSKKRVARDVFKGLQIARDEAIAARGMGLGSASTEAKPALRKRDKKQEQARREAQRQLQDGAMLRPKLGPATKIELKDGSKKLVYDPTEIYVDQAWVGRGTQSKSPEFRARGRVNMLTHRTTSFSVLLKEEKTRMRISDEIQKKRDNRKLWLPLPDRPVTSQRQYCLW